MATIRIYKDEYKENQISFLRSAFAVVEETVKVVIISGAESQLENVMACMYSTDEKFKSYFPDFRTETERKQYTAEQIKQCKNEMLNTLCRIASNGYVGQEFIELRKIYFENFA